jgi:hypothetical protein
MRTSRVLGALAFAGSLALATPLLAGNESTTFTGSIGVSNPCNGAFVSASGPVDIHVETNTKGKAPVVSVHMTFKADGSDSNGDAYSMSFIGNENFDAVAGTYDVPYRAEFIGKGNASNFTGEGLVRVFVTADGVPTGAFIITFSSECTN